MATRRTVNRCRMNFVYNRKTTLGTKCIQRWEQDLYNMYTTCIQLVYNLYTTCIQDLYNSYRRIILQFCHGLALFLSFYRFVYNLYTTCIQNLYSHKTVTVVQPQNNVGNKIYTTCKHIVYNFYTIRARILSAPNLRTTCPICRHATMHRGAE